jgi:heme/copper-type cytochrome/quinol oxidase subunit 2
MRLLLSAAIHLAGTPAFVLLQRATDAEAETNTGPMVFEWVVRALLYVVVPLIVVACLWYLVRSRTR